MVEKLQSTSSLSLFDDNYFQDKPLFVAEKGIRFSETGMMVNGIINRWRELKNDKSLREPMRLQMRQEISITCKELRIPDTDLSLEELDRQYNQQCNQRTKEIKMQFSLKGSSRNNHHVDKIL